MNDDDQKNDTKAKEKDFWDKLTAVSKIVAASAGLIASIFIPTCLQISTERNRKTQIYAEIMSQREQADTDLRAKMFETLFDKYLGDLSEQDTKIVDANNPVIKDDDNFLKSGEDLKIKNFDRKITLLDLLTNNFQEYFNAKPIFERLYRGLKKEEDEILENKIDKLLSWSSNGDTDVDPNITSAKTNRCDNDSNAFKNEDPNMPKMDGGENTISFLRTADIDTLERVMDLLPSDDKKIESEKIEEYKVRLQDKRLELLLPILELELAKLKELTNKKDEILRIEQKIINFKIKNIQYKLERFKNYLGCYEKKPNELKTKKENEKKVLKADIKSADNRSIQRKRICKYLSKLEKKILNILSDFDSVEDLEDFNDKRRDINNDLSATIEMINNLQKYIAGSRYKTECAGSSKDKNNIHNKEIVKIKEYLEDKEAELAIEQDCNSLNDLDFVLCKLKQLDKNLSIDPNNEGACILDESINEITQLFENLEKHSNFILVLLKDVSIGLEREKIMVEIEMAIDNVIKEVEKFILSSRHKSNIKNLKTNIEMHLSKIKVSFLHQYRELKDIKSRCKELREGREASFINELRENIERMKNRRKLRYRLISLAQTTASRQVNMLARVGTIRTVSLHKNYKEQCLIRLYDIKGYKYKNKMDKKEKDKNLKPFTYSIDNIQPIKNQPFFFNPSTQKAHHYSVWIKIIDLQEDNVKMAVKVFRDHFKKRLFRKESIYLYSELVETEAINFWVSYFDMPYMDNTRLYDGSRFAVTLKDLDLENGYVLIQLASFREEFMSIRDRPLFEEMLMKIKDQ